LYIRYNFAIDTHADNGMVWANTFIPEGTFVVGGQTFQGRAKLAEFAKLKPGMPGAGPPHPYATNIRIEASPEGATGSCYFFNVPTPDKDKPAGITTTGTYEDTIVRTGDGWRFKKRVFHANALAPSLLNEVAPSH